MDHRTRRPLSTAAGATILASLASLALLALLSCTRAESELAGSYQAQSRDVRLELKDTGKGVLSTPEDDTSFTWERRGREVWLHTKGGGVVVCAVESGPALAMDMPGVGRLRFTRR